MIPAINSATSFKAFYKPNNFKFSEQQKAVIKDIESKLGDRTKERDFCVVPEDKNAIGLYKVSNPRVNLFNNNLRFDKMSLCAICDEWHPFDVEKYDAAQKILNDMAGCLKQGLILIAALATSLIVFYGIYLAKGHKQATKAKTELVQKADTLIQKADSLKNNIIKNIK